MTTIPQTAEHGRDYTAEMAKIWEPTKAVQVDYVPELERLRNCHTDMLEALTLTLKRLGELNRDEAGIRNVIANAIAKAEGRAP